MNFITLTTQYGDKAIHINADRIDAMADEDNGTNIFMGGSDLAFRVKESSDDIKSMCEPYHVVTKRIDPRDSGPRLNIDEMY